MVVGGCVEKKILATEYIVLFMDEFLLRKSRPTLSEMCRPCVKLIVPN